MAEERIWDVVLNSLGSLEKKLDSVAQDVAAMRTASTDLTRRVACSERDIDALQKATSTHASAIDRHDRQLGTLGKLLWAVVTVVIGAVVMQLLGLLGYVQ